MHRLALHPSPSPPSSPYSHTITLTAITSTQSRHLKTKYETLHRHSPITGGSVCLGLYVLVPVTL